jgi:hypothetical protein
MRISFIYSADGAIQKLGRSLAFQFQNPTQKVEEAVVGYVEPRNLSEFVSSRISLSNALSKLSSLFLSWV